MEESERLEDFEMREILFRGKVADEPDEWVYGYLLPDARIIQTVEFTGNKCCGVGTFQIRPETLGQYTGLTDKNGKKIFEGDIVQILGDSKQYKNVDYNALIIFKVGGFCAIDGTEDNYGLRRYCLSTCDYSLKVIGNIHDNPELLK